MFMLCTKSGVDFQQSKPSAINKLIKTRVLPRKPHQNLLRSPATITLRF